MNSSSINALIAEHEKEFALMLTEALQDILPSCKCVFMPDGIAALRYIKNNDNPDLVFLNLDMPLKNGINCLKDIYNLKLLPATPVITYASSANIKDINDAYEYGAAFYLVKPTTSKELNKIIKRAISLLGQPRSERLTKCNFVLKGVAPSEPFETNDSYTNWPILN
ncbi:response regulator [Segetibacter koreensis]|uniref:response regulator n=1 Tax=Segetibacter koreensis TaxID=398037 RepID=UPI00035FE402|nr:response regulator [Segetibacter koreensis]